MSAQELTNDKLLGGRLRLSQPPGGYRAAIDPVLLAAAVAGGGDHVIDVGCGTAAAALCLAARSLDTRITGLERLPPAAALARANVTMNGFDQRITIVEGDLLSPPISITETRFDQVMMNPPYLAAGRASPPPDPWKAAANVEGAARLADWIDFAARRLGKGGALTLIHRADRLDEILTALGRQFGGVTVFPLWPKAGAAAKRVIVRAIQGSRAPMRLAAGLILHHEDGGFTGRANAILSDGAPLDLN